MSAQEIIDFLISNKEFFTTNDIIFTLLRKIGWGAVWLCRWLQDLCAALYDYTFGLVDITNWTGLNGFIQTFQPLITAFLFLSLSVLGVMFIMGKHKKHNVFVSVLIFAVVMTSSNSIFSTLNQWAIMFKDGVVSTDTESDANALINANLYDLIYIDESIGLKNLSDDNAPQYNNFSTADFSCIDIGEMLNYRSSYLKTDEGKEILKHKLVYLPDGESTLTEVSDGWGWNSEDDTDLGNEFYYRYKFHYGTYYMQALALILIFVCLSYKNTRIIYELFVSKILVYLMATDMSNSKKAIKVLTGIRDGYFALCFTAITLKSYTIFTTYLSSRADGNGLVRVIVTLFIAFCVIDGASIMEKITGVDAGLSSITGKIIAGAQMYRSFSQSHMQKNLNKTLGANSTDKGNLLNQSNEDSQKNNQMNEAMSQQNNMNQDNQQNGPSQESDKENGVGENGIGANGSDSSNENDSGLNNMSSNDHAQDTNSGKMENMNMDSMDQGNETQDAYSGVEQNMNRMDETLNNKESSQNKKADRANHKSAGYSDYNESPKNDTEMFQRSTGSCGNVDDRGKKVDNYPNETGTNSMGKNSKSNTKSNKEKKDNISPKDI